MYNDSVAGIRRTRDELLQTGVIELANALGEVNVDELSFDEFVGEPNEVRIHLGSQVLRLMIVAAAVASPGLVRRAIAEHRGSVAPILVADDIPVSSRQLLNDAGWNWLEQRKHLRLRTPWLFIDSDLNASEPRDRRGGAPLGGQIALSIAVLALLAGADSLDGVRPTARALGVTAGGVSKSMRKLIEHGLLTSDYRGAHPELFWATVNAWKPDWIEISSAIDVEVIAPGASEIGTRAAIAQGAPLVATADYPKIWLVPTPRDLGRLRRGASAERDTGTRVAVAPTVAAMPTNPGEPPPAAIIALHLASEGGRAAEALELWEHPERVW